MTSYLTEGRRDRENKMYLLGTICYEKGCYCEVLV